MSKFVILECNRDRAIDINKNDELNDEFKNRWTNQVSNSGIVVNSGDILTIEQSIINVKGASTEVMEFTGENNDNNIVDNKVQLEMAYYINHTGKNTARMPMINHRIFRGVGDLRELATNPSDPTQTPPVVSDGGNTYVKGDQRLAYNVGRFQNTIGDRSLGETFFLNYPFVNDPPAPGQVMDPYDSTLEYTNTLTMPRNNKIFRIKLKTRGGGVSGNLTSGYSPGVYGVITNDSLATGTAMQFRVLTVSSSGDIPGIIETFDIEYFGELDFSGFDAGGVNKSTITIDLGATPGTPQVYEVENIINSNYKSSDISKFDGKKFFPLAVDFTGLAFFEDAFVTRTDGDPPPNITDDFDLNNIVSQPTLRTSNVELEISKGFQTPDNVANLLTRQLSRPQQITDYNDVGQFLETKDLVFFHKDRLKNYTLKDTPTIVGSQVNQPCSCNFTNNGKNVPRKGSFCGRRTTFYQSIAWLEPERWTGLVPAFKQFSVKNSPNHIGNDIAINYGTRAVGDDDFGDFTRQGVGEFGCHTTIISDLPKVGANEVDLSRGSIFVSNIRYTQRNINRLIYMKECEKYMGDLSLKLDTESDNFKNYLSVNLDVGIYDDELSTQGPLTTNGLPVGNVQMQGQRFKFNTIDEAIADGFILSPTDRGGFGNNLHGYQRDLENYENSGQDLSNIWVKSRWNDKFAFDENNIINDNDIRFQDSFDSWDGATHWNSNNTNINQVFGEGYTDSFTGEYVTIKQMNDMAKNADLAIVPVNVPRNDNDLNQNAEYHANSFAVGKQPPFIGFISPCDCGDTIQTEFNKVKQFSDTSKRHWIMDSSNCKWGMMFGFDPSFTRNKAVCLQNNQFSNEGSDDKNNYLPYINIGASSPQIKFDPSFSRFSISGLNTPEFIGNGLATDDPLEFTPNDNPEQQVITFNRKHQICLARQKDKGTAPVDGPALPLLLQIGQFNSAEQEQGSFIDSQSGVALIKMKLYDENGNISATLDPNNYFNKNDYLYHNSLFDKMGFKIETLLPKYGDRNTFFRDPTLFRDIETYQQALQTQSKPLTTGADIDSSINQEISLNFDGAPLFDLGGDTLETAIKPDVNQGEIIADNLPNKFEFSYLTINSSLVQQGTDTIYIGGNDNQSKLPCMSYLTRENNESDFFYQNERSFTFTATKDFTITDITTDIRLPNGGRPNLDPHSTIIYKIEKPLNSLSPQSNMVETAVRQHEKKIKQNNLDK